MKKRSALGRRRLESRTLFPRPLRRRFSPSYLFFFSSFLPALSLSFSQKTKQQQNDVVQANLMGISRKMKDKNWTDSQGRKGKGYGVYRFADKYGVSPKFFSFFFLLLGVFLFSLGIDPVLDIPSFLTLPKLLPLPSNNRPTSTATRRSTPRTPGPSRAAPTSSAPRASSRGPA